MRYKKIIILGPSGTGKTTLAKYISCRYRMIMRSQSILKIADANKFEMELTHKGLIKFCIDEPTKALELYRYVLNLRCSNHTMDESFVSDRSLIDLLVYFNLQLAPHIEAMEADKFRLEVSELILQHYATNTDTLLVFIPFNYKHYIEDNDCRLIDSEYQSVISSIFDKYYKHYISTMSIDSITLDTWEWDQRVKIIEVQQELSTLEKWRRKIKKQ